MSLIVGVVVSRTAGALVDAGPHARVVVCRPSSLPCGRVDTHTPEAVAGSVQQRRVGWVSCRVSARKQGGALLYRLYIYIYIYRFFFSLGQKL